jgi:opacity protein-like surface antigen
MKKILLGAAAAIAIAAPSVAAADTNAVVGLQYSNTDIDGFGDFDQYGLNGAFSHDMGSGVLQMDGEMGRVDAGGCCVGNSYGAVHYGWRNDSHAFGGFAGLSDFFIASGLGVGVEGQLFLGNFNLGGSVGHVDFDDFDLDATSAQIDGAYFLTPNFAINGLVAFSEADFSGSDADWTTLGIGGEWRFDSSPFSIDAGYRNTDFDGDEADTWTVGVNWDLGTASVQDRTRTGPGFQGARNMFDVMSVLLP